MKTFVYAGRARGGLAVRGERVEESARAVAAALRNEGVLPTSIVLAPTRGSTRVLPKALAVFTRQLSVMVEAGVPLLQGLELLGREEPHRPLALAIANVRADVEAGVPLSDALCRQPRTFGGLYVHMVAAGEAGGALAAVLQRLAAYIEQQARLRARVRAAMMYPCTVMVIAAGVVGAILWKVVPAFTALFAGLGAELPAPTRAVIWMSRTVVVTLPLVALVAAAGAYGTKRYYEAASGRLRIDRLRLSVPLLGPLVRKIAVARFCRTLGTLIASGVPILSGFDITAATSGNAVIESAIRAVRARVERGETIAAPLRDTGVFPAMVAQMIGAGESTGALDVMLAKVADFYEEDVEVALNALLATLEPVLVAALGLIVGGIVISMYLPLFSLINQLAGQR